MSEEVMEQVREQINYILAVKMSQRCGTERCQRYDSCGLCLANQILSIPEIQKGLEYYKQVQDGTTIKAIITKKKKRPDLVLEDAIGTDFSGTPLVQKTPKVLPKEEK